MEKPRSPHVVEPLGVEQLCLREELGSECPTSLSICPQRPDCCPPLTSPPRGRQEPCDIPGGAALRPRTETNQQTLPSRQENSPPLDRAPLKCYRHSVFYQVIEDIIANQEEEEKKRKEKKKKEKKTGKKAKEKKAPKEKSKVRNLEF